MVNFRMCRDGGLWIILTDRTAQISRQQMAALLAIAEGASPSQAIIGRQQRSGAAWTASERASVSRTLRRLRAAGLTQAATVNHVPTVGTRLTDLGVMVVDAIREAFDGRMRAAMRGVDLGGAGDD